jgi:hypothetical protein
MKYATVKNVMASFPHPFLPTVQSEPDYQTIQTTQKFLRANSRAIKTHLGGGTLGHLGLIISDASYAMKAPTTDAGPTLWTTPPAPGLAPYQHGWNSGQNQYSSPHLGGGCSDVSYVYLRATSIEKTNHWCV